MSGRKLVLAKLVLGCLALAFARARAQDLPDSIYSEGVPAIPPELDQGLDHYRFYDSVSFQGWLAGTRRVVYLFESGGTQQVFVRPRPDQPEQQLTSFARPVSWVCPHPTRERMVIAIDQAGQENYQLLLSDQPTGVLRIFTNPYWRNTGLLWSPRGHFLALTSNARNGADRDLYVVTPPYATTGRRIKDADGTCSAQDWSPDERRIVAVEFRPDWTESCVELIDVATGTVEVLPQPSDHPVRRTAVRWSRDGGALYWLTNRNSEFLRLGRYDLATKEETPLTAHIPWDIEEYDISGNGNSIVLVANEDGQSRLHVIDARTGDRRPTPRFADGLISNVNFRPRSQEFAFTWSSPQSPPGIYSYDLATRWKTEWIKPRPASPKAGTAERPELIRYESFDGRKIPAFVRRPKPTIEGPYPVLIELHGGLASQARPAFSSLDDYLVDELGIALVSPNVRGSSGYGLEYEGLDDCQKREDGVRDIAALLDWIASQRDLDASRVAVRGGSYGGYMTLSAMMHFSHRLRAGIDISGISSLETSLAEALDCAVAGWRAEYGDERDPETRQFLRAISPLENAAMIKRPLLVIHGENDPRVKVAEAERIVAAVRRNGVPVWYVRFSGEGHGFDRREHSLYSQHAQVLFLCRFLLPTE